MAELWKDIPGYEGQYQASSGGQIRSLERTDSYGRKRKGKVLARRLDRKGYDLVQLPLSDGRKNFKVHRLVCTTFHGPPFPNAECMHANDIRHDNRPENLSWGTYKENQQQKFEKGRANGDLAWKGGKLTPFQAFMIQTHQMGYGSGIRLARALGVRRGTIDNITRGVTWSWL